MDIYAEIKEVGDRVHAEICKRSVERTIYMLQALAKRLDNNNNNNNKKEERRK